tara:strand:+ start:281 stop:490 length:210 start_codon:yes stop_codon:yes gene_type:complete
LAIEGIREQVDRILFFMQIVGVVHGHTNTWALSLLDIVKAWQDQEVARLFTLHQWRVEYLWEIVTQLEN